MSGYDRFVRGVHASLLILALAATAGIVWIESDIHATILALHPSITYGEQTIKIVGGAATDLEKMRTAAVSRERREAMGSGSVHALFGPEAVCRGPEIRIARLKPRFPDDLPYHVTHDNYRNTHSLRDTGEFTFSACGHPDDANHFHMLSLRSPVSVSVLSFPVRLQSFSVLPVSGADGSPEEFVV